MYKASVIMNTWNQENKGWLQEAIDSYLNQDNVEIQLIISTVAGDTSMDVLKSYGSKIDICLNEKPCIFSQINKAFKMVKNPWICYAASDDVALPNKVYDEIKYCIDNDAKVCCSSFYKTDEKLNLGTQFKVQDKFRIETLLKGCYISDCSMIHESIWAKYGPFDIKMDNMAFWDFWIRIGSEESKAFTFNKDATWLYRQHSSARHTKRVGNEKKIIKREAARKRMMRKHVNLLKKHNLENLLKIDHYKT